MRAEVNAAFMYGRSNIHFNGDGTLSVSAATVANATGNGAVTRSPPGGDGTYAWTPTARARCNSAPLGQASTFLLRPKAGSLDEPDQLWKRVPGTRKKGPVIYFHPTVGMSLDALSELTCNDCESGVRFSRWTSTRRQTRRFLIGFQQQRLPPSLRVYRTEFTVYAASGPLLCAEFSAGGVAHDVRVEARLDTHRFAGTAAPPSSSHFKPDSLGA
jgi:hypothetical protein